MSYHFEYKGRTFFTDNKKIFWVQIEQIIFVLGRTRSGKTFFTRSLLQKLTKPPSEHDVAVLFTNDPFNKEFFCNIIPREFIHYTKLSNEMLSMCMKLNKKILIINDINSNEELIKSLKSENILLVQPVILKSFGTDVVDGVDGDMAALEKFLLEDEFGWFKTD
jgi:hypothetical protein